MMELRYSKERTALYGGLVVVLILFLLLLAVTHPVSAVTVTETNGTTWIDYSFSPELSVNDTVWFNGEQILRPVTNNLYMTGLEMDTEHQLLIDLESGGIVEYRSMTSNDPSHINPETLFSTWALLVLGLVMLVLTTRIPVAGYAGVMVLLIGVFWVFKTEVESLIILAYVLAFFGSIIVVTKRDL